MDTGVRVRELADEELPAAWHLGRLAFGSGTAEPPPSRLAPAPGLVRYGAFDTAGRLLGKAVDLHHEQWWTGRRLAAADIVGVAVAPEARGGGVARALLTELLRGARERGAAVSALYPTVVAPYRACGWEVTGALRTVDLPTALLPRHRPAPHLSVSAGGADDLPAVTDLYERIARPRNGLLTRRGAPFDGSMPPEIDGLTLVTEGERLVGYAAWQRGLGYGDTAVLTVRDLIAGTAAAARALTGLLAGWQSVTPVVRFRPLRHDSMAAELPLASAREQARQPWMHRPVDVVRAVRERGWPAHVRGTVDFALSDVVAPWNSGAWRLEVADGSAELTRVRTEPDLALTVRGFALLYAGTGQAASVVEAGLASCPAGQDPAALDLLGSGQPAQLLDYF